MVLTVVMARCGMLLATAAALSLIGVVSGIVQILIHWRWSGRLSSVLWIGAAFFAVLGIFGATLTLDYYLLAGSLLFGISLIIIGLVLVGFETHAAKIVGHAQKPVNALGAAVGGVETCAVGMLVTGGTPGRRGTSLGMVVIQGVAAGADPGDAADGTVEVGS